MERFIDAVYLSDKLYFFTTVSCSQLFLTGTSLRSWQCGQEEGSLVSWEYRKCHQGDLSGDSGLPPLRLFPPYSSSWEERGMLAPVLLCFVYGKIG